MSNKSQDSLVSSIRKYVRQLQKYSDKDKVEAKYNQRSKQTIHISDNKTSNENSSLNSNCYSLWNNSLDLLSEFYSSEESCSESSDSLSIMSPSSSYSSFSAVVSSTIVPVKKIPEITIIKAKSPHLPKRLENGRKIRTNCAFCKNNGQPKEVYTTHLLKDPLGNTVCPFLKNYKCPICAATGKNAHTITYCKKFDPSKRINTTINK